MSNQTKCLISNAAQIVQVVSNRERYIRGNCTEKIKNISILEKKDSDKLSIVSIKFILFLYFYI